MQMVPPEFLDDENMYYIEYFGPNGRLSKYRGTITKGNFIIFVKDIVKYIDGQKFSQENLCIPIDTKNTDTYYWLFYEYNIECLLIKQVIRQRTQLDEVTIWGLHKLHIKN